MNKYVGISIITFSLLVAAFLGYIYYKNLEVEDNSQAIINMESIHELKQIDSTWSLVTLQTLSTPNSDFDNVAAFLTRYRELRNHLSNSELAKSNAPAPLKNKLLAFLSLLEGKEMAIEQFKSYHAVSRNSLKYLPLAAKTLSNKAKDLKGKNISDKINSLHQRTSYYLESPEENLKLQLLQDLNDVELHLMEFPSDIVNPLGNFISHARVLVQRKAPMGEIVARITSDVALRNGSELISLYRSYLDIHEKSKKDENDQYALFTLIGTISLVLIAIFSGIYTFVSATIFTRQLEEAVRLQDSELERQTNTVTEISGTYFDINQCIESALNITKNQIGKNTKIFKNFSKLPKLSGDQSEISQAMINLISNAELAIQDAEQSEGSIKISTTMKDSNIVIDIQDNGVGMNKSISDQMFDPSFTTREANESAGPGLATVQKIIRQHNGKIAFKSVPGKGTLFRIILPRL